MKEVMGILFFLFIYAATSKANGLETFSDLLYAQNGSCEAHNLNFNAARFSKIDLKRKSIHNLDLYLQVIFFIREDGTAKMRTVELGLTGCKDSPQGEVCGYRPYSETKKLTSITYKLQNEKLIIEGIGEITKIRDDIPWLGFELVVSDDFPVTEARQQKVMGGKVQVNFNEFDQNAMKLCP